MKWEYCVTAATSDTGILNELGSDGWELVCCIPRAGGFEFVFKRVKK